MDAHDELMLAQAEALLNVGWRPFPLVGKVPAIAGGRGFHDAATTIEQVRDWWGGRYRGFNIGCAVPEQLIVIDFDPRNGADESAAEWEHQYGPLPRGLVVASGRGDGGEHNYLRRPRGELTASRLPKGIDLKIGGRGYCVMPPSLHPDTGGAYRWLAADGPGECPEWLFRILRAAPHQSPRLGPRRPSANSSDEGLVDWLATQKEGNRNDALFWCACRAAERKAPTEIFDALLGVAVAIGLSEVESRRAIASAQRRIGVAA